MSFTGSYTGDEPNFPRQNNYILQKMVFGLENVVNFKEFYDLIKKSRPQLFKSWIDYPSDKSLSSG